MITKYSKPTGKETEIDVEAFLNEVSTRTSYRTRISVLSDLIEGGMYQDLNAAYYIKPIRISMGKGNPA